MAKFSHGRPGKAERIFRGWVLRSRTSRLRRAYCGTTPGCSTNRWPPSRPSEFWRRSLASPELEAILGAIFEAEFCPPEQKQVREHTRDTLLRAKAEQAGIPWERMKWSSA